MTEHLTLQQGTTRNNCLYYSIFLKHKKVGNAYVSPQGEISCWLPGVHAIHYKSVRLRVMDMIVQELIEAHILS